MNTRKVINIGGIITSILSLIMIFFSAITIKMDGKTTHYKGIDIIFGRTVNEMDFKASFLGIILLLLVLAMVGISLYKTFMNHNKAVNFALVGVSLIAAIIFFIFKTPMMVNYKDYSTEFSRLGIGAVLGGLLCLITAVLACADYFIKNDD